MELGRLYSLSLVAYCIFYLLYDLSEDKIGYEFRKADRHQKYRLFISHGWMSVVGYLFVFWALVFVVHMFDVFF